MKKLTLLLFVALCSILLADGTPAQGQGTESSPYLIANLDNLLWLSTTPEVWGNNDEQFYFKQTADIDASDTQNWNDGFGFSPIGINGNNPFYGNYDGNNKVISNLYIRRPEQNYVGFFGAIWGMSEIKNLGLENGLILGRNNVGSFVGYFQGVNFSNCYSTSNVAGNDYVGGLIGKLGRDIEDCFSEGIVSGHWGVGGLVGGLLGAKIQRSHSACYVTGEFSVGGLVGFAEKTKLYNCYSVGNVNGTNHSGGIVGSSTESKFNKCYSTGNITGSFETGGAAGTITESIFSNCFATGNVNGQENVAGFVSNNSHSTISSSYSTGIVTGTSNTYGFSKNINPQYCKSPYINNCFWNTETSGQPISNGGIGKTTNEMKQQSTYRKFFFGYDWGIDPEINNGYPFLIYTEQEQSYLQGEGSTANPYKISSFDDLLYLNTHPLIWDKTFLQTENIDAIETRNWSGEESIKPIGNIKYPFTGTYNGNNKTISNLFILNPTYSYIGLFGYTENGFFKNLKIENCFVTGGSEVGGLIGIANRTTIRNCSVSGMIRGGINVGGLIGRMFDSKLFYCSSKAEVYCFADFAGGLVGATPFEYYHNNSTYKYEKVMYECYATGSVYGRNKVGGLIGYCNAPIENSYAIANVTGNDYVGGLTGVSYNLTNCYSHGTVSGNNYVGGLTGKTSNSTIKNSFSTCSTSGNNILAGLIGISEYSNIRYCYSTGFVDAENIAKGLIGQSSGTGITNSYWDIETSGQTTSAGGIGKTTAEMKQQSTYQNWLFGDVWAINPEVNNGYPYFVDEPIVDADDETNQITPSTNAFSYVIGPNPFNPSTNISFNLSKSQSVNIKVYNIKGQLVKTLLNKKLASGQHTINFNAAGKASGVYFINVKVNGKNNIKKALLLK